MSNRDGNEDVLRLALEYVVARLDTLQRTIGWTEEDSPGSGVSGATWAGSYVLDAQDRARAALAAGRFKDNPDILIMGNPPKRGERLTLKGVQQELKQYGMVMKRSEGGDYRVNFRGGSEATAYYTDSLDDARDTGYAMSKEGDRKNPAGRLSVTPGGLLFSKNVIELRYVHMKDGKKYKHPFGPGVHMIAEYDGSIRLVHPKHKIWEDM